MKHKRLERLAMFAEVAEQLSFAKAAEHIGVSKGHLSEQVKKLEQDYGVPLMVRSTRNIRLTTEGKNALDNFKQIGQLLEQFELGLAKLDGTIRITAPALFTEIHLTKIIKEFKQLHPNVSFDINTSYQRFDLTEAHFDMAFRATQQPPPANMIAKKLFEYQPVIAGSPNYLNKNMLTTPEQLLEHSCLTSAHDTDWQVGDHSVNLKGAVACNSNPALKQMALDGEGLVRLPSFYLEQEIQQGLLTAVLQNYKQPTTSLYLLYPTTTRETSRLRQFTSFVADYFG